MSFSKLPKTLKVNKFDFQGLQQKEKQYLKENKGSLSKRNSNNRERKIKSLIPNNRITTQTKLSMIVRTPSKPKNLFK